MELDYPRSSRHSAAATEAFLGALVPRHIQIDNLHKAGTLESHSIISKKKKLNF
jgi:hypothetical protein